MPRSTPREKRKRGPAPRTDVTRPVSEPGTDDSPSDAESPLMSVFDDEAGPRRTKDEATHTIEEDDETDCDIDLPDATDEARLPRDIDEVTEEVDEHS